MSALDDIINEWADAEYTGVIAEHKAQEAAARSELRALREENAKMREALLQYACDANWLRNGPFDGECCHNYEGAQIAKDALSPGAKEDGA